MLNNVRDGNYVENLLKARFICESYENYPKDVLHMYAQKKQLWKGWAVLDDLSGELYTKEANGKITDNCKYPLTLIQAAQNQK